MSTPASPTPAMDEWMFLTGRPPLQEFLGLVAAQYTDRQSLDLKALSDEWRLANNRVRELEAAEGGWADSPAITPIGRALKALRDEVLTDPLFQRSSLVVPVGLGVVELDRLIVHQTQINLSYVQTIKTSLGAKPNPEQVFRCCLPVGCPATPVRAMRVAQNSYVFVSPSNDFRFLDSAVLRPEQLKDFSTGSSIANVVGLILGFSVNHFTAIHVENRLILHNGNHRAFALRDLGVTHAPCAILEVTHPEELAVTAPEHVHQHPKLYLSVPRPPLLKDFFDPRLRKVLHAPRKLRQLKITFGVESINVPG
jgi:hypothetical protein